MAIKTIDLNNLSEKATSVYEAVLVVAKRARAITAERKAKEALQESEFDSTEALEAVEVEVIEEEKAIVMAMDDFFEDKLEINYREPEVEEEPAMVSEDAELIGEKESPKKEEKAEKSDV